MVRFLLIVICFISLPVIVSGNSPSKVHTAIRTDIKIRIDGELDESVWGSQVFANQFTQFEPNPGLKATFDTEVRVVYDDGAVYIAALMKDPEPDKILKQLSARDQRENSSWFSVAIDPYQNAQLGFAFNVTSAGVQQDMLLTPEGEDLAWNAVWESAVKITDEGWVAEIKIPYSAIRFPQAPVQTWGFQLGREIRRTRESSFWSPVSPTVNGFMTQFGVLEGINDIEPPVRLSVTPFVIGYADIASPVGKNSQRDAYYSAGMDLKYGINDAFTLDMTLIPDFGQTQSDNNVLNLSPFEVFFEENRQFFTEGLELFDKGGLFYSRRIGGHPINRNGLDLGLEPGETIEDDPSITRLYNATKVSGRMSNGLGIGLLNSVGAPTDVIIQKVDGSLRKVNSSPLTNYNVLVLDQSLRANSSVTFTNTNVWRAGQTYDANATGLTWDIKNINQTYAVSGLANLSQIYRDEVDLGYNYFLSLEKISGNFQGAVQYGVESDTYNPNDLGFLSAPNERFGEVQVSYNEYNPSNDKIQLYRFTSGVSYERLFNPNKFVETNIELDGFILFKSRDAFGAGIDISPTESFNYFEPRVLDFSEKLTIPINYEVNSFISSDYRKTLAIDARVSYQSFKDQDRSQLFFRLAPRIRFSDQLFMIFEGLYTVDHNEPGYVNKSFAGDLANTSSDFILFGNRDRDRIEGIVNLNFIFNDKMSLSTRVRHYWDRVVYQDFGWLKKDGYLDIIDYNGLNEADEAVYDRNLNLFNIDMVYTWRFAPGSDIIVVWKNQITKFDKEYDNNYFENLSSLNDANQFDSFSFKLIYFLDYLYFNKG